MRYNDKERKGFIDVAEKLARLNTEAIEAYQAAINRLENNQYRYKLSIFKGDHTYYYRAFSSILEKYTHKSIPSRLSERRLTNDKLKLVNLSGDKAILKAMKKNESDMVKAYEEVRSLPGLPKFIISIIERALQDESIHLRWLSSF